MIGSFMFNDKKSHLMGDEKHRLAIPLLVASPWSFSHGETTGVKPQILENTQLVGGQLNQLNYPLDIAIVWNQLEDRSIFFFGQAAMPSLRERFEKLGYSDRELQACRLAAAI